MPNQDAAQPLESGLARSSVPASPDAQTRARRRAEVLRLLSRERRRQRCQEPTAVRWTGPTTA